MKIHLAGAPRPHRVTPPRAHRRVSHPALPAAFAVAIFLYGPAAAAQGDPGRGAEIYGRCAACHSLERNRTGPKHCGIFGRTAGSLNGFDYSEAMTASGIVWDRTTLDAFIASPTGVVPGTLMGYDGIKDRRERADLIAYLEQASASPELCK